MKAGKWKSIPMDTSGLPVEDFEMLGGIEELTDYKITRGFQDKKIKKVKKKAEKKMKEKRKRIKLSVDENLNIDENNSEEIDMSAWTNFHLHEPILRGLRELGFEEPTEIQKLTIPSAVRGNQDILGAAETGSGKTLAFGIPIVNSIISIKESRKHKQMDAADDQLVEENDNSLVMSEGENDDAEDELCEDLHSEDVQTEHLEIDTEPKKPLYCLILTPTRELAIQIKNHLQAICKYTDILVSVVVGGMAPEKQRRILKKCPEIIVATPGRLWELIEEGESHVSQVASVRYMVIDEADRMVEKGHFAELTQILSLANGINMNRKRQTFVFSATLTLMHSMPNRLILKNKKGKTKQKQKLVGRLIDC